MNVASGPTASSGRSVLGPAVCRPGLRPVRQVSAGAGGEGGEQVGQRRVLPAVLGEVGADAREEAVPAGVSDQLLEHRRAFVVADRVEVGLRRAERGDVGRDRMRGRLLVLQVGGGLAAAERGPGTGGSASVLPSLTSNSV